MATTLPDDLRCSFVASKAFPGTTDCFTALRATGEAPMATLASRGLLAPGAIVKRESLCSRKTGDYRSRTWLGSQPYDIQGPCALNLNWRGGRVTEPALTGINCRLGRVPNKVTLRRALQFRIFDTEDDTIQSDTSSVQIVKTFKREGVTYNFYTKPCTCCGELLYFVGRTDGAKISCFQISEERTDDVEKVIEELHESFAIDIRALIDCLNTTLKEITSKDDLPRFLADGLSNFRIRPLDRARLILKRFSEEGKLEYLETNADSIDDDLVAAFTLGYLSSEN
jgi:hypothetical protein